MEVIQDYVLVKLIKLDLSESVYHLPSSYIDVGFAANSILKKWGTLESTKECQFKSNVKTFQTLVKVYRKITNQVCVNTAPIQSLK